jgi:hypothetical protein
MNKVSTFRELAHTPLLQGISRAHSGLEKWICFIAAKCNSSQMLLLDPIESNKFSVYFIVALLFSSCASSPMTKRYIHTHTSMCVFAKSQSWTANKNSKFPSEQHAVKLNRHSLVPQASTLIKAFTV